MHPSYPNSAHVMPPPLNAQPPMYFPTTSFSHGGQQSPMTVGSAMLGHCIISSQAAVPAQLATRQPPGGASNQQRGSAVVLEEPQPEVSVGKKITAILGYEEGNEKYAFGETREIIEYCWEDRWAHLYDSDNFSAARPDDPVTVPTDYLEYYRKCKVLEWGGEDKKYITVWKPKSDEDETTGVEQEPEQITVKVGNIKEHISKALQGTHFKSSETLTKKEFDKWYHLRMETRWALSQFLDVLEASDLTKYKPIWYFVKRCCDALIIWNNERVLFELVLENKKPLLVSLKLSAALSKFARRNRSKNLQKAGRSGELAAALEELARAVARSTREIVHECRTDLGESDDCLDFVGKNIVWTEVGSEPPRTGTEIKDDRFVRTLEEEFIKKKVKLGNVQETGPIIKSYIKSGDLYYTPGEFPSNHFENEKRMRKYFADQSFSAPSWLKGVKSIVDLISKIDQKRTELKKNQELYGKEIDESMEFATTHGLKAFVSESMIVSDIEEKWSGVKEHSSHYWSDTNIIPVDFLPDVVQDQFNLCLPVFLKPNLYEGIKVYLIWPPFFTYAALIAFPLALLTCPWPPSWRFWAFQTSYVTFAVLVWFLPVLVDGTEAIDPGVEVSAAVLLMTHLWAEVSQLCRIAGKVESKKELIQRYTQDFWNCVDAVALLTATAAGVARACLIGGVGYLSPEATSDLQLYAIVLVWMRIMTFLQTFSFSGPLLYMVQTMILKDFSPFALLVVCVMLPFCAGLSNRFETQTNFQSFGETCGAFLKMFVDAGKAPLLNDDPGDSNYQLGLPGYIVLWIAYLVLVIVMANLLIAMFSKTFDVVFENSFQEYFLKRAELLSEWKDAPQYPPPFNVVCDLWSLVGRSLVKPSEEDPPVENFRPSEEGPPAEKPSEEHRPAENTPPPVDALPPGWKAAEDQLGRKYYYNKEKEVSQWTRPVDSSPFLEVGALDAVSGGKDAGVEIEKDPASGKIRKEETEFPNTKFPYDKDFVVPPEKRREWIKKVLEDLEENGEQGTEEQLSKFKNVVMKTLIRVQKKLETQEKLLERIHQQRLDQLIGKEGVG